MNIKGMRTVTAIAKLTSKHQLTLPAEIRRALGAEVGDHVLFHMDDKGSIRVQLSKQRSPQELFGILHREGQPYISLAEARKAIQDELAEQE